MALSKALEPLKRLMEKLSNIEDLIIDVLNNLEFEIEQYQRDQLSDGLLSDGNLITPKYSRNTKRIKAQDPRYNAPFGTPNLLDSGDFYDSILADVSKKFIDITATDSKLSKLTNKYSDKILGWNEETKKEFSREILGPAIVERLKQI